MSVVAATEAFVGTWRAETPGCALVTHLNNAGAALMPRPVHRAITDHLADEVRIGAYEAAEARGPMIEAAYQAVARVVGAAPRNIAIVQNSTVAFAQALAAFDFAPGDAIVTSRNDYASNQIMYLSLRDRRGVEVIRVPDAPEGGIDPDAFRRQVTRARPRLVALTWIPTNSGLVQPAERIGEICAELEIPYLVDACQAVGQLPIDVSRLHCDYLAATARKFLRGPRGIGFLYVSDSALAAGRHPLLVDMHGATWTGADEFELAPSARRFETWEFAFALVLGLGAAAEYSLSVGLDTARDRSWGLAARLRELLAAEPWARVLDRGAIRCAIVTAAIAGCDAAELKLELRRRGVNTSSPDREDAVIDMDEKGASSAIRLSPHYYNTEAELERAVQQMREIVTSRS